MVAVLLLFSSLDGVPIWLGTPDAVSLKVQLRQAASTDSRHVPFNLTFQPAPPTPRKQFASAGARGRSASCPLKTSGTLSAPGELPEPLPQLICG